MSGRRRSWIGVVVVLAVAAALGVLPTGLVGQTPATAVGLGYPVPPVDARAAALGSTGVGLLGGTFSLRNPAELTEHPASGIAISAQPEDVEVRSEDGTAPTGRSRFSTLAAVLRVDEWGVGLGFGSELDQDFVLRIQDTLPLDVGRFPFEERREHDGGVSAIELSVARRLGPFSIGVAGQRLSGSLRQEFERRFEPGVPDSVRQILNVASSEITGYSGWRGKVGASFELADRVMAGASLAWAGTLEADPELDAEAPTREFDLPVSFEAGVSLRPVERLLLTAAGGWTGWSSVGGGSLEEGTASDVTWLGGGAEYWGVRVLGAPVPLRVGLRRAELPFSRPGFEPAEETAFSAGLGVVVERNDFPLVEGNAAFEVGDRGELAATGFEESFRRLTLSFTLRQP